MVVKLYGHPISTTTQRVLLILTELAVPYELIQIRFHELEHKSPAHREHHPFGQVPYIVDSDNAGFEVFESRAICRYLALKYGGARDAGAAAERRGGDGAVRAGGERRGVRLPGARREPRVGVQVQAVRMPRAVGLGARGAD